MGFSYLKIDFLYMAAMRARAFDARYTRAVRLRRALGRARGRGRRRRSCSAAAARSDPRSESSTACASDPTSRRPGSRQGFLIPGLEAALPATGSAIRSILSRACMHRRFWLNDPDCLMARRRDTALAEHEVKSLAASIATTGGMVVFSDDVPALSPAERAVCASASRSRARSTGPMFAAWRERRASSKPASHA